MERTSEETLFERLEAARAQVPKGDRYSHFKHPDREYVITGHALNESTESVLIIYEACYGKSLVFARPLEVFLETVEYEGKQVPRFSAR